MIDLPSDGLYLGRVWRQGIGPSVVTLRGGRVIDVTARGAATVADVLDLPDPAAHVRSAAGEDLGPLDAIAQGGIERAATRRGCLRPAIFRPSRPAA